MEKKRQKILLTENQEKVIKDKYLKDAPSVEAWLDLVASNIALADVLHSKLVPLHQMYNGVSYKILEKDGIFVLEYSSRTDVGDFLNLRKISDKTYGDAKVTIFQRT